MRTSCGSAEKPPANSASPLRKEGARSRRCCGTNPKTSPISARSRGAFTRRSPRLSHCESTFGWTFVGRCVERNSQRPNFRPSAAIWMSCSVSASSTAVRGAGGQKLCASSITMRIGRRSIRRSHRCSSTHSAAACGSVACANPPTSSTVARGRSSRTSVAELPPNAHSGQSRISRLSIRSPSLRRAGSAESMSSASQSARSSCRMVTSRWRSALNSSSSRIGSSRAIAACECTLRSTKRVRSCSPGCSSSGSLLFSTRMSSPLSCSAAAGSASSRVVASRTKSAFGSRIATGSSVRRRSCSSTTPSAYVFPEPLCPHQKVWRLNREPSMTAGRSGSSARVPTVRGMAAGAMADSLLAGRRTAVRCRRC